MFAAHNAMMNMSSFVTFNEQNTARTNQAIPVGTSGCWVTLIGGGGGGGGAGGNSGQARSGGGGGGGGAGYTLIEWV